jgi:hypothetical protein
MKIYKQEWNTAYAEEGIEAATSITKFHCRFCDKDYAIGTMGEGAIKQHIVKESHQGKKVGVHWTDKYAIQGIRRSETDNEFYCDHCERSIKFARGKESAVEQHIQSQGHQEKINAVDAMNEALEATDIERGR